MTFRLDITADAKFAPVPQPAAAVKATASYRPLLTADLTEAAVFFSARDARMAVLDQGHQPTLRFEIVIDMRALGVYVEVYLGQDYLGLLRGEA